LRKVRGREYRRRAAQTLANLYRVAEVQRAAGEFLQPEPWLKVLANVLSSASPGPVTKRSGRDAPECFGLNYMTLLFAAERCGLVATGDMIGRQVEITQAWRQEQSERIGRPHTLIMRPDMIGELLGITDEVRREARAWSVGTFGGSPEERKKARLERQRIRDEHIRRDAGALPRQEYLANSLSRTQPWEAINLQGALTDKWRSLLILAC
jgi:hypothetical protein